MKACIETIVLKYGEKELTLTLAEAEAILGALSEKLGRTAYPVVQPIIVERDKWHWPTTPPNHWDTGPTCIPSYIQRPQTICSG